MFKLIVIYIIWVICSIYLVRGIGARIQEDAFTRIHPVIEFVYPITTPVEVGAQNVHDSTVRKALWNKYHTLVGELSKMDTTITNLSMYLRNYAVKNITLLRPHCTEQQYNTVYRVLRDILRIKATIVDTSDHKHDEIDIYSAVFYKYKVLKLDWSPFISQIIDCVDPEDNMLVCVTGRVSRYLSVFDGMVDGYLGQTEITEELLYQDAINRTKVLLDNYLDKNPQHKDIYNDEGTEEEEKQLSTFLTNIRYRILKKLIQEYPTLETAKLQVLTDAI